MQASQNGYTGTLNAASADEGMLYIRYHCAIMALDQALQALETALRVDHSIEWDEYLTKQHIISSLRSNAEAALMANIPNVEWSGS